MSEHDVWEDDKDKQDEEIGLENNEAPGKAIHQPEIGRVVNDLPGEAAHSPEVGRVVNEVTGESTNVQEIGVGNNEAMPKGNPTLTPDIVEGTIVVEFNQVVDESSDELLGERINIIEIGRVNIAADDTNAHVQEIGVVNNEDPDEVDHEPEVGVVYNDEAEIEANHIEKNE